MSKFFSKILLLIFLCFTLSTASVYATWHYSNDLPSNENDTLQSTIIGFEYNPDAVLPGDQESTELHENHFNLVTSIVNHVDYGLNATKKPIVRKLLEDGAGVVYSNQSVSGGNLKHMLLNTSDVNNLMFVVQYSSDNEYIAYTFTGEKVNSSNIGTPITVYKTIMVKNTRWEATLSYTGTAEVFYADNQSVYSIDVSTWQSI